MAIPHPRLGGFKPLLTPLLTFLLMCLLAATPLNAQEGILNHTAPGVFGGVALGVGFTPDPFLISGIAGGGDVDALARQLGDDCFGFVQLQPTYKITTTADLPLLRAIFIADAITVDTTLIVRLPDGRFLCNNNALGLFNPMVSMENARPGEYAVWVGGFTPGTPVYGDLYLTANPAITPGSTGLNMPVATLPPLPSPTAPPSLANEPLLASAPPAYGEVALQTGFLPDPYWMVMIGGGGVDLADAPLNTEGTCAGFTDAAPDLTLDWASTSTRLRLHYIPADEQDAALIVRAPDGTYTCNDTFAPGFTRPMVEFIRPAAGAYQVWVANETAPNVGVVGALYITELTTTPETVVQVASTSLNQLVGLDPFAASGNSVALNSTLPDPSAFPVSLTDYSVDIAALNPEINRPNPNLGCEGYYSAVPTLGVNLAEPTPYWRLFVLSGSDADTTLIVRMPDGRFYCGDDSYRTLDPTVNVVGNLSTGTALVWVGSYRNDAPANGVLVLTRGMADPTAPNRSPASANAAQAAQATLPPPPTLDFTANTAPALPPDFPLTPNAEPNYGDAVINASAIFTQNAVAGGDVDVSTLALADLVSGEACNGFVTAQPDLRISWSGGANLLITSFVGDGDATLLLRAPDGRWFCNDDSNGTASPSIAIAAPPTGVYAIWIGSYSLSNQYTGVLTVNPTN